MAPNSRGVKAEMARTKPTDPNKEARDRAAARRNAKAKPPVEDAAKEKPAKKPAKEPVEMKGGGIVGAAEEENKVIADAISETTPETPEAQTQETAMGEGIEASDEQAAETEPPTEVTEPEMPEAMGGTEPESPTEPEVMGENEPEAPGMEPAPEAQAEMEGGPGEYQPPAGQSYDELLDAYHEALAYGDNEQARNLRDLIREHEYLQIKHRLLADAHDEKLQAKAMAEEQAFLATAQELAATHPELGVDGLEADKVLALKDVYWQYGTTESDALRQAVADLYPGEAAAPEAAAPAAETAPEMPMAEPAAEMPMAEAMPEEPPVEAAPEASNVVELPDMTDRMANKRKIPSVPTASARTAAAPKEVAPSRSSAIQQMRAARGQV